MKIVRPGSMLPARLQQMTPAISQTESVPATPRNVNMSLSTGQATDIQRISNQSSSFVSNTTAANAYNNPALTSPSTSQLTRGPRSRNIVDLTQEPDDEAVKVKQEATDTGVPEQKSGTYATVPVMDDDDDEEDLKDELRKMQIKRKLRAMEKKRLAAGKMGA
jgi:hypothetical protein